MPDEDSEEDERSDRLFVATHGKVANLYDLDKVSLKCSLKSPKYPSKPTRVHS